MLKFKIAHLIGFIAAMIAMPLAPSAFAEPLATGVVSSNGTASNNPGFDARGEALEKVVMKIQGQAPSGVPRIEAPKSSPSTSNGISYHGGKVMTSGVKINIIWYGTWSSTQKLIITDMISTMGGTPYFNINTTYYDGAKNKVLNKVSLAQQFDDNYSQGTGSITALSDAQIWSIVSSAAATTYGAAIKDINAITLVLTSADVKKSSFLTSYCGWHTYSTSLGTSVKYSFVGNPGTSTACGARTVSPNGDPGVDAMASVIAHEIVEATTDPELNAWYDTRGYENADKCAWNFGTTSSTSSGAAYNVTWGSRQFLIQMNWLNANGGSCKIGY